MKRRPYPVYIAIDLGATSGRVAVSDSIGDPLVGHPRVVHRFTNPSGGGKQDDAWDVVQLFEQTLRGLRLAADLASAWGARIAGIGVCSWGVDYALMNDGKLRVPPRRYQRMTERDLQNTLDVVDAESLYGLTGVLPQKINTLSQLHRDSESDMFRPGDRLLFMADLWIYWLSGQSGTDITMASTTQLLDPAERQWCSEVIRAYGIREDLLPSMFENGIVAGDLAPSIRSRIGCSYPIPVWRVTGHDTAAAFSTVRTIGYGEDTGYVSSGSWIVAAAPSEGPTCAEDMKLGITHEIGVACEVLACTNIPGLRAFEACRRAWSMSGYQGSLAETLEAARRADAYQVVDLRIFEATDDQELLSTLSKELASDDRGVIARSVIETLADYTVRGLNTVLHGGLKHVIHVGGGVRNSVFAQALADRAGVPVTAGPPEAAAMGVILQQLEQVNPERRSLPLQPNLDSPIEGA